MSSNHTILTGADAITLLQTVLDNITDDVVVMGQNCEVLCCNHLAHARQLKMRNKELKAGVNYLDFVSEENRTSFIDGYAKAMTGQTSVWERLIRIGNEQIWFHMKVNPLIAGSGNIIGVTFTATDIDARKKKELELEKLGERLLKSNRELTLLTKVNDLILSTEVEQYLLDAVCRLIVEFGGYRLAWISYGGQGKDRIVLPVASYGQTDYLSRIKITLTDPELSKGPTARTLLGREKVVTNSLSSSPGFRPWLEMAKQFGIASSIVLPLEFGGEDVGTLNIYAASEDAFDEHEIVVLDRLAGNLSLAVRSIRTRREIVLTKHTLNERVKELSTIYNVYRVLHDEILNKGEVLAHIVPLLPPGWQYPEICSACITFEGVRHMSEGFKKSRWCQRAEFKLADGRAGLIEVVYSKEMLVENEGPFLTEERSLIKTIASTIEVFFNRAAQRRELEASEARFRTAFEESAIGMALVSLQGEWMMVNSALSKMLGYTNKELLDCSFQGLTHPEDIGADVAALHEMREGKRELYRAEKRFIHKDGSTVWINLNVALLRDKNGVPLYNVAQIENITERIESQMKFRDLVEKSVVGVYILQDDMFVYVNPWVVKEFGYREEELIGHSVFEFIVEEDQQRAKEDIEVRLDMHLEKVQSEVRARRKDGSIVWLELFGSKTLYSGKPSIIGTMVDITARKHLEAERRRIIADLVQRNREITDFAEIVSHNLRGPLSTVLGACSMIEEIEDLADLKIISAGLLVNAEKLDSVVRNLNNALSFKSSFTAQVRSVALADVLEEVKRKHEEGVKAVSPDIITDFEYGFVINTVTSLFTDLISNIFSNCLLYRSPDRKCRIVISARKTPAEVVMSITDNGIGINMKLFGDKLFGLNKRFHNIGNGTGLGLFMSKAMVEVLNGSIGIESEVGIGTTVTIKLPA
ncbi:MAG: PAS domain S-box protein [Chitinophagaceae bacterium]|nr:PAS domain S-box protein [Chitinophagaceae bacterium]